MIDTFCFCDPGSNGAFFFVSYDREKQCIISCSIEKMPACRDCLSPLYSFIDERVKDRVSLFVCEEIRLFGSADMRGGKIFNLFPLLLNYNTIKSYITYLNIKINIISAKTWQSFYGLCKRWKNKTEKKNKHKALANILIEEKNVPINEKVTLLNCDAILLGLFFLRMNQHQALFSDSP